MGFGVLVKEIRHEDCIEGMKSMDENSIDAVVTDPPYGLGFMNREWDSFTSKEYYDFSKQWGKEALRVLKPGGHLLAFSGCRTYHLMTFGLEEAGFEVRDMISWVFGSGFPKSLNVGKAVDEWEGWGSGLKPSHEPVLLARKPLSEPNIAENVVKWGTGAINIDGCRIGIDRPPTHHDPEKYRKWKKQDGYNHSLSCHPDIDTDKGRFPANLVHDGSDEATMIFPNVKTGYITENHANNRSGEFLKELKHPRNQGYNDEGSASRYFYCANDGRFPANLIHDGSDEVEDIFPESKSCDKPSDAKSESIYRPNQGKYQPQGKIYPHERGSASRFFYCPKVADFERNAGLEELEDKHWSDGRKTQRECPQQRYDIARKNSIATLKPINLMRYLVRLITPPKGIVLDPFAGSGTTGCACVIEGFDYVMFEKREEFAKEIIPRRIAFWKNPVNWKHLDAHKDLPLATKATLDKWL